MSPPARAAARPRKVGDGRRAIEKAGNLPTAPLAPVAPAYDPKRGAPILVVEDSPQMRRILSEILTGRGYGVRTAGSGAEALQIVKNVTPGLVLLDMMLPSMGGWAVARELLARQIKAPIIVMADAAHALKWSYEVGGVEALGKPFAMEQLVAAAERHYQGSRT